MDFCALMGLRARTVQGAAVDRLDLTFITLTEKVALWADEADCTLQVCMKL